MWRVLPLALAVLAIGASLTIASSGAITDVAPVTDGIFTATFRASSDQCAAGGDCRWFAFATQVGPLEACDDAATAAKRVYTGAQHETPGSEEAAGTSFYPDTEEAFKLCLFVSRTDATEPVGEYLYTPPADAPATERLTRRDAGAAARNYLGLRFGAWPGRTQQFRCSCHRVDRLTFRCLVRWRSEEGRFRGAVMVHAVSASRLRVRSKIRKRR